MSDAPPYVWFTRMVAPPGETYPDKANPQWEAVVYKRVPRKEGFSMWMVDRVLAGPFKDAQRAQSAGASLANGIPFLAVTAFDLALKLEDIAPDPVARTRIRLGEGWKFAIAVKSTFTSRGGKALVALVETDRQRKGALTHISEKETFTLISRMGRLSEKQVEQLTEYAKSWEMRTLDARTLPVKAGKVLTHIHGIRQDANDDR